MKNQMPIHNPPHPGEIIRGTCLDGIGLAMQTHYDLWQLRQKAKTMRVKNYLVEANRSGAYA